MTVHRCPRCGAFLTPINDGTDRTCGNARCAASWQAEKATFESSMLGAAARQITGVTDA